MKERAAKSPAIARRLAKLERDAAAWLERPVLPPAKGGGFYHDPNSDYQTTAEHYRCSQGARDLALLRWILGDEVYVEPARAILLAYARTYTTFAVHDKEGRTSGRLSAPGRATAQAINEAKWLIPLAWAYDLLYDRFDPEEREAIERGVFHPAARLIMANDEGRHNHQSWYNAGVGVVGFLLGEQEYVDYALHKPGSGFHAQMEASLTPDGFWYEGSGHYHFFALESLLYLAEAAAYSGVWLYGERVHAMFRFPLRFADPQHRMPRINDGREVDLTQPDRLALYEIGYRRYGDPEFAALLARGERKSLWFLLFGEEAGAGGAAAAGDADFPPGDAREAGEALPCGLVVLRQGKGDGASYAVLNLMPHAGGHSHPDKLGLVYYAAGRTMAPDSGSIRYRDPLHLKWFKHTIAHNTVTVDLRPQSPAPAAELLGFVHTPYVTMARARTAGAYPGVIGERTLVMTGTYLLDIFRVTSGEFHWWDWAYRNVGRLAPPDGSAGGAAGGARVPGYDDIQLISALETGEAWSCRWEIEGGPGVLLQMAPGHGTTVYFGRAPIASSTVHDAVDERPVDMVVVRRRSNGTIFAALIQPIGTVAGGLPGGPVRPETRALRRLDDPDSLDGAVLVIDGAGGATDFVLAGFGEAPYACGNWRVKGGPVWLRVQGGSVRAVCTCGPSEFSVDFD